MGAYLLTVTAISRLMLIRCASAQKAAPTELVSAVETRSGQTSPRSDPDTLPAAGTHVV